ncbi:MAG: hypothetical protein ACKOEO_20330, partial [Planctomycetaceae bacterium]
LELNVRDSLSMTTQLTLLDLNLRVFGNSAGIQLDRPVFAQSLQLTAPDGTVTLPEGTQFFGNTLAIKAKKLVVPENRLNLSTDTLTLVTAQNSDTSVQISNDRDLTVTPVTNSTHLVQLDAGIAGVFQGITWVSRAASEWMDQVFDGRLNPYAVIADKLLTIDLPPRDGSGDEDTLTALGGIRSWSGAVRITADEMDFLGGPATIRGTDELVLKSATSVWTTRLGTAAETGGGSPIDPALAPQTLDLPTRDVAALADGFRKVTIGRGDAGNLMRLGDAFDMTAIKATGEARVVDARIKDTLLLLAEHFIIEGDFRAPLDDITLTGDSAEIRRVNLHTPNNSTPDSGLRGRNVTLNLQDTLHVGGWVIAETNLRATTPNTEGLFSLIVDVGGVIRQTASVGSLAILGSSGIRVAGEISTNADGVTPAIQAGGRFDLLAGADIAATGDDVVLTMTADEVLSLPIGSTVRAGVSIDLASGSPEYTVTGTNGQIILQSAGEVVLAGLVATSGGLRVSAAGSRFDHSDFFRDLASQKPDWYIAQQERYAILVTGTVDVLGDNEHLVLSAGDDVVVLGNITMSGANSSLTLQSDSFTFVEGRLTASKAVNVLGGVELDGTNLDAADSRGSSVYLGRTGAISAAAAGSSVIVRGGRDVDVFLPLIAGGTVGATGVTWAGDGSFVEVSAGQQIYLDAPIQAAANIVLSPGTAGADDGGKNLVFTDGSGLNAAGLGLNNTGSVIRFESTGDLQIPINVLSGGTIRQTFGSA